ncbi:MAG: hypothetical protein LBS11_10725 [Oscillospiraceae bacterium]|jgi:hypothetical protein|nr:hypothetical protein [Oscillospiraceae bacterium]
MFETNGQASIFLAAVYGGLVVGLLYDAFTLTSRVFGGHRSVVGALDLLFALAAAGVFALTIALSGGNGMRGYMLLGFGCGGLLYAVGLHHAISAVASTVSRTIRRVRLRAKKRRAKALRQEGLQPPN